MQELNELFQKLLDRLTEMNCEGRCLALAKTHMETASMWANKGLSIFHEVPRPRETKLADVAPSGGDVPRQPKTRKQ